MPEHAVPIVAPGADRPVETGPDVAQPVPAPATKPQPGPAPAPVTTTPFAPKGRLQAPKAHSTPGLSSLLDMVAFAPWAENKRLEVSTFVPDASALFYVLNVCDTLMRSTDRFTRAHPQWIPYVSRVYFAMLYYFRVMDCLVHAGIADSTIITLLNQIKQSFDFRRLAIPGPLVPFFQAISVCDSGHPLIGDVSPCLPSLRYMSTTGKNILDLNNSNCPNVLALLEYPTRLAHDAKYKKMPDEEERYKPVAHYVTEMFNLSVDDRESAIIETLHSVGFAHQINLTEEDHVKFARSAHMLNLPPRIDLSTNSTAFSAINWHQALRLSPLPGETNYAPSFAQWFGTLAAVMSTYATYFTDSSSLGSIPLASGAAPLVQLEYEEKTKLSIPPHTKPTHSKASTTPKLPNRITLPEINSLSCTGFIASANVPATHQQLGTLTQINSTYSGTETAAARTGPAWSNRPSEQVLSEFDTYTNFPSYVSSFHRTRALE